MLQTLEHGGLSTWSALAALPALLAAIAPMQTPATTHAPAPPQEEEAEPETETKTSTQGSGGGEEGVAAVTARARTNKALIAAWASVGGVGDITARALAEQFTIADLLLGRISPSQLSDLKRVSQGAREALLTLVHRDIATVIAVVSKCPGLSSKTAADILSVITTRQLATASTEQLAGVRLTSGKLIGWTRATSIGLFLGSRLAADP